MKFANTASHSVPIHRRSGENNVIITKEIQLKSVVEAHRVVTFSLFIDPFIHRLNPLLAFSCCCHQGFFLPIHVVNIKKS